MELVSTVATPPSLMKLKTELGKNSVEDSSKGQDQGKFSEVLKNHAEKGPLESKDPERVSVGKKPELPVKRFQTQGQSERLTSEREKAILKFMDSFESEFGIPPQEMVVAMAGLSPDQMTMAPEETADTVISQLKLDDQESVKAQQAYLGFLMQLSLIDSKASKPFLVDPNSLPPKTLGGGSLTQQGLDSLTPKGLEEGIKRSEFAPMAASEKSQMPIGPNQTDAVADAAGEVENDEGSTDEQGSKSEETQLGSPRSAKGDQASSSQAFLKPQVRERVLASLERKAERDLSLQNLNNKFWMKNPTPSAQDLSVQGLALTGNPQGGKVSGDQMLDRLMSQENSPGFEGVGFDGDSIAYESGRAGQDEVVPFMVAQGNVPANSRQKSDSGAFQDQAGDGRSGQKAAERSKALGGIGQKKVSVEDMNFRQMADALNGDRSLSQGQSSGAGKIGNHIGADGLTIAKPSYENEGNIKQIMNQAQYLIKNGGGEMKVKMSPEGLGELQLKVVVADGKVNVQMMTETKEAKNAIESSLSELKNSLSAQKLSVEHVRIDVIAGANAENRTDQGMNSNPNGQRDSTRQFWNQFQESFGNRSQRDGLFDFSGKGYVSKKEREPLQPIAAPASARRASGKGSGLNLVA